MVAAVSEIAERNGHANGYQTKPLERLAPLEHAPGKEQDGGKRAVENAAPALLERSAEVPSEAASAIRDSADAQPAATAAASNKARAKPANSKATKKYRTRPPKVNYVPQAELDAELARLNKLSRDAMAGDTQAFDALRAELDHCPHIWRRLGDLQVLIEEKLIALVAGNDPLRLEAFRKRTSELRRQILEDDQASITAQMAASRVVSCWLFTQRLELRAVDSPEELRNIKQLEQAERRFQVAMRTLLMVKRAELQVSQLK